MEDGYMFLSEYLCLMISINIQMRDKSVTKCIIQLGMVYHVIVNLIVKKMDVITVIYLCYVSSNPYQKTDIQNIMNITCQYQTKQYLLYNIFHVLYKKRIKKVTYIVLLHLYKLVTKLQDQMQHGTQNVYSKL